MQDAVVIAGQVVLRLPTCPHPGGSMGIALLYPQPPLLIHHSEELVVCSEPPGE